MNKRYYKCPFCGNPIPIVDECIVCGSYINWIPTIKENDKHRWHDLQEDPDDLPDCEKKVHVRLKFNNLYGDSYFDCFFDPEAKKFIEWTADGEYSYEPVKNDGSSEYMKIIAWKEK